MIFEQMLFWHWWVAGLLFMTLEVFLPGAIFLWMGISAFALGGIAWLIPAMTWQQEFVLFAALSIISALAWRKYRPAVVSDSPTLNRRGESYVGRSFTLEEDLVNGTGKLRVDDSQWRISGPDLPAGTQVRVTRADGATLHVEAAL